MDMIQERMNEENAILIIDDDEYTRTTLADILVEKGYRVHEAVTLAQARDLLQKTAHVAVLLDLQLPDGLGIDFLKEIRKINEHLQAIILTGYSSMDTAIAALNEGAFAYLQKPIHYDELFSSVQKAVKMYALGADNKRLIDQLTRLTVVDSHTGLYNHRYLQERLSQELQRAKRHMLSLSVLMLDIDYFKSLNEVYGHQYADFILAEFGRLLLRMVRSNDVVTRYGGEEFILILPETNKEGAAEFGQRLLTEIINTVFDPDGKRVNLKVSMGVSNYPQDNLDTVDGLIESADKAVHEAKELGGSRLCQYHGHLSVLGEEIRKSTEESVDEIKTKFSKMARRANGMIIESVYALAKTIDAKDHYTSEHSKSMVSLVTNMGKKLNLPAREIEDIQHAAVLHDLGKIGIADDILHKTGPLTDAQYDEMKKHPQLGAEILRPIQPMANVIPMILYHHERYDGTGYPEGLRGEAIPLGARIIAIADVFQALTSDRVYRKTMRTSDAIEIIKKGGGTQFDPNIVQVFLEVIESSLENYGRS